MDDTEKEFTLRGRRFRMRRQDFINALRDQRPQRLLTWAVDIEGTWYPPKQIVRTATGASQFTSHEAIALLRRFGFEAFDATRGGGRTPPSLNGESSETVAGESQQTPNVRLTALREAIQFVSGRPDGTVDEVLEAAERFEAWLSQ